MKLVFVGNGLHRPDTYPNPKVGGSVQTWFLCKELAKRGHQIYIIRRSRIKRMMSDGVNLVGVDFKGFDSLRLPFWNYLFNIGALVSKFYFSKKSLEVILEIKPDLVCLMDRITGIFPSYLDIPKIYILHVPEALDFFKPYAVSANKLNSVMFYVKKFAERMVFRNSNQIVALSSFICRFLKNKGYRNVSKIPNGVDIEHFSNKGDEDFILYAGRFDWNKNVYSLLNAFADVHKSHPDYDLYLVGEGPERAKIQSLLQKKGVQSNVKFFPWLPRTQISDLMSRCSILVLPSFFEAANPVVVMEAMASSKPVIAKANMGTVDIIMQGQNGYLYTEEDELRKYLHLLLSDRELRKILGRNARKTVEQKYTFDKIAGCHEKLYESIEVTL